MARRIQGATGTVSIALPGGWMLDAGDEVVVSDEEWAQIDADDDLSSRIIDLGSTSDPVDPVPSWRDIQRGISAGPEDGPSLYTWVKYADTPTTGMSDSPVGKTYIGLAYNKTSSVESTDYADYEWALIKGSQGIPGPPGDDGQTLYTWIKYADTPTSGISDSPVDKTYMGIAYNKTTSTESETYDDYAWSLIKGAAGVPGPPGDDGAPTYTWIKYADDATGAGLSNSPVGKTYIGIAYNKPTATESTTASDYEWALIQGAPGSDAYTVLLTNESHTFAGSAVGALAASTVSQVLAFKGAAQLDTTIGTITGQVTGLTTSIQNNGTDTAQFTVTVTTALVQKSGELTIPITVDGVDFTKKFSWSVTRSSSDGLPPTVAPTVVPIGGIGSMFYRWTEVPNADPVTYRLHVRAGSAPALDGSNEVASGVGLTSGSVRKLTDGSALVGDGSVIYHAIVTVEDDDNDATHPPVASADVIGIPAQVTNADIAVNALTANLLTANDALFIAATGGTFTGVTFQTREAQERGIKLGTINGLEALNMYREDGSLFFKAAPVEGMAILDGEAKLKSLTVAPVSAEDGTSLGGVVEITRHPDGSPGVIRLTGYTTAPKSAPTVTTGYDTTQFDNHDGHWGERFGWTTDGTYWYTLRAAADGFYIEQWNADGSLNNPGDSLNAPMDPMGCVVNGTTLYVLAWHREWWPSPSYVVFRINTSTWAQIGGTAPWNGNDGTAHNPAIGFDPATSEVLIAQARPNFGNTVRIRRYTISGSTLTAGAATDNNDFSYAQHLAGVTYGAHDFGADRYVFTARSGHDLFKVLNASGNTVPAEDWEAPARRVGFAYTGTPGVNWRGAWAAGTAYAVNDGVTYNSRWYRRKVAGTTATNPSADATNWELAESFVTQDYTGTMRTFTGQDKAVAPGSASMTKSVVNSLYAPTRTVTVTTSNASQTVLGDPGSFLSTDVGATITGPNLQANTTITGRTDSGQITVSLPATASGSMTATLGTPLETTRSPTYKIAAPKRAKLIVDTSAINTGGSNAPDRVRIYAGQDRSATVGTTNNSPNLSGTFTAADVGASITGVGIPSKTTILSQTGTAAVMSKNASATAASVAVVLSPGRAGLWKQTDPAVGGTHAEYNSLATSGTNPPAANGFQVVAGTIQQLQLADGTVFVDGLGNGTVGTGTFRDSVDARANAMSAARMQAGTASSGVVVAATTKIVTVTFPTPFTSAPKVVLTGLSSDPGVDRRVAVVPGSETTTQFQVAFWRATGTASFDTNWLAVKP